jgi:pimeloyl-ACP methyl ester carboxylesterase
MNLLQAEQKTVTSHDGTTIALEQSGAGPAVILVSAALADRSGMTKLARQLTEKFMVINYDRRGRGKSGDHQPFAVDREVEDIEALIQHAGGFAYLFGWSSGAVLALEAASKLGDRVAGLFMYEPPFIIDNSHPAMPENFAAQIEMLVADGRRSDAVKLFFHKGMGIPGFIVTLMRYLMPGWSKMATVAHTIPYDLAVLAGTQDGKPLPSTRWNATHAPTLIMVGGKSPAFFHAGAKALVQLLRNAEYQTLPGRSHGAVMMAPKEVAAAVSDFFLVRATANV